MSGQRMFSTLSLAFYKSLKTKKTPISHLNYLDFARVRQVWKSRLDDGLGHIHYSHTNARHGGRWFAS